MAVAVTTLNLTTLNTAIHAALEGISGLVVQNYNELTESISDTPLAQVYFESGTLRNETGQSTFRSQTRRNDWTFHVDLYIAPRAHVGEDMSDTATWIGKITDKFDEQKTGYAFGVTGAQTFSYSWQRVSFDYGGQSFVGVRFVLTFTVY